MSSIVCQGLQSCLEPPRLVEQRVLRHKLSPPKSMICQEQQNVEKSSHTTQEIDHNKNNNNGEKSGGWNFIQALINPSSNNTKQPTDQTEKIYVHPLVKRSASALSSKSLEMCTESLGSETGSDISSDEFWSFSWEKEKMQLPNEKKSSFSLGKEKMQLPNEDFSSLSWEENNKHRSNYREFAKKMSPNRSFPPPLTSISGSNGVKVRPHREGGRLVMKAVRVSSCGTYFQADRTNGRLVLSLTKESSVNCDSETTINKNIQVVYNEEEDKEVVNNLIEEDEELDEDDEVVLEDENVNEPSEEDEGCWGEDMEGNDNQVEGEIGIGELARPSRCKESGRGSKGMSTWGPFCVAIS